MTTKSQEWRKTYGSTDYLVSTSRSLLQLSLIQRGFSDPLMYWAKPIPDQDIELMLDNSCNIGLYSVLDPSKVSDEGNVQQLGIARLVTDYVTFAYLTDVYIVPECQGLGLGKWLIACVKEVMEAMPQLRRALLLTKGEKAISFYERELGFNVHQPPETLAVMIGNPRPSQA